MKKRKPKELGNVYTPVDNHLEPGTCIFRASGRELKHVLKQDIRHIWTIVEASDGFYAVNGMRLVKRLGYIITEEPWKNEHEKYRW